nr:MAG TPA: hypothetical protein [Caudoviricetes sp.]
MNNNEKYQKLYKDIELVCLCIDAYEDAEEYLKPLRELINHHAVLEDALTRACERIEYENTEGKLINTPECPKSVFIFAQSCCRKDKCRLSNKECWKEWFLQLAKQKNRN